MTELTFPRQYARTQRLTLGEPRNLVVSPDGLRVVFCRSAAGDDPVNNLWVLDLACGTERMVADPRTLLDRPGLVGREGHRATTYGQRQPDIARIP